MINSSPLEYAFIRVCIVGLQSVLPFSVLCTLHGVTQWPFPLWIPLPVRVWCGLEVLFFVAFMGPWLWYLQRDATHLPLHPEPARRRMFERAIAGKDADQLQITLSRWFDGAEVDSIGREAVKDWLGWAFFEGRVEDNTDELEEYISRLEAILGKRFAPGKGSGKPLRLTLDPFATKYPSLLWYFCVGFVDFLTFSRLSAAKFTLYREPLRRFFTLFPFRPVALTTPHISPARHLTYWLRPHTSKTRPPILYIHGIGIGLYPYTKFLTELDTHLNDPISVAASDRVGILAVEIMPISFRITAPIPDPSALCAEIATILAHHGWDRFVLVSHSYGSVIATHLLHDPHLRPRIASTLFIDPVCFLLADGDVAHNFTVRKPVHANEWQLWYFASLDPAVAHTLARRFFWSVNVLWREDLVPFMEGEEGEKGGVLENGKVNGKVNGKLNGGISENAKVNGKLNGGTFVAGKRKKGVTVSLASRDLIVNTEAVARYLSEGAEKVKENGHGLSKPNGTYTGENDLRCRPWRGKGLDVLWFDDLDHAQVFDATKNRMKLIAVLKQYCNREAEDIDE